MRDNNFTWGDCVAIVKKVSSQYHTLQKVIRGRISLESVIYSDGWRGYNGLVDLGYEKHLPQKTRILI